MNKLTAALKRFTNISDNVAIRSSNVDLSGAINLFGTMGQGKLIPGNYGFVPVDDHGGTINLDDNGMNPKWLGLQSKNMQYWAYNYCSPLAAVIDRLAEADTNGRIEFINNDKERTTVKNPNKNPKLARIAKLFKKPNPLQTWEEFNSEQVVLCKIFGYCPVLAYCPVGMDKSYTKYLFNLNPFIVTPRLKTGYDMFEDNDTIIEWYFSYLGTSYTLESQDIIIVKDGFINQPSIPLPLSKVAGLDFFISNICAGMEADNVLLKKKGPLGVFSFDPKPDMAGWTPMKPHEKKEIQDDLGKYGLTLGQLQYIVSKIPIKWNPMSFNVEELKTKETVRQGIDGICDRFGYPAELMSGKNATYENRNSAEKFLYQNNVIPFSLRRMARYNDFFGLEDVLIFMDYDHLPVLQEDIMHAGQARYAMSQSLVLDWTNGIITFNQYLVLQGLDTVAGMNIYYPEWLRKNPEMKPVKTKTTKDATPPSKS